jgi:hypothetical protein
MESSSHGSFYGICGANSGSITVKCRTPNTLKRDIGGGYGSAPYGALDTGVRCAPRGTTCGSTTTATTGSGTNRNSTFACSASFITTCFIRRPHLGLCRVPLTGNYQLPGAGRPGGRVVRGLAPPFLGVEGKDCYGVSRFIFWTTKIFSDSFRLIISHGPTEKYLDDLSDK